MATYALSIEHAAAHDAPQGFRHWITGTLAATIAAWRRHAEMRRAERRLYEFSDRMLEDLGVKREDIATVVRGLPPVRDDEPIPYWSR